MAEKKAERLAAMMAATRAAELDDKWVQRSVARRANSRAAHWATCWAALKVVPTDASLAALRVAKMAPWMELPMADSSAALMALQMDTKRAAYSARSWAHCWAARRAHL
jgi:hypothetical protein